MSLERLISAAEQVDEVREPSVSTDERDDSEVAVIGAGPYGLAVAAHLRDARIGVRVFGDPMSFWRDHMPKGMKLRSPWCATHIGVSTYLRRGMPPGYCRNSSGNWRLVSRDETHSRIVFRDSSLGHSNADNRICSCHHCIAACELPSGTSCGLR